MKCVHCNGTGKFKKPNDEQKFNDLVECEVDKAYYVNYAMAEERAYQKVGFTWERCPHCNGTGIQQSGENS